MKQGPADTSLNSIPNSAPVHKARGRQGNALGPFKLRIFPGSF